jgi:hypothetical protein
MRKCAFCEQRYEPSEFAHNGTGFRWCRFCTNRYIKIWQLFKATGHVPPGKRQLHRAWNVWRQTPELDRMYPPFETDESRAA